MKKSHSSITIKLSNSLEPGNNFYKKDKFQSEKTQPRNFSSNQSGHNGNSFNTSRDLSYSKNNDTIENTLRFTPSKKGQKLPLGSLNNSTYSHNSNILNGLKSSRNFSLENINSKRQNNNENMEEHTWRAKSKTFLKREYSPIMELENEESDISCCTYSQINTKSEIYDTQYQHEVYTQKLVNNLRKEIDFLRNQNNELRDALIDNQKKMFRKRKKHSTVKKNQKNVLNGEIKRKIQNLFLTEHQEVEKISQNFNLKVEKNERRLNKACMNLMYILSLFDYREKKRKEEVQKKLSKVKELERDNERAAQEKKIMEKKLNDMRNRVEALQRKFQDSSRTRINKSHGKF